MQLSMQRLAVTLACILLLAACARKPLAPPEWEKLDYQFWKHCTEFNEDVGRRLSLKEYRHLPMPKAMVYDRKNGHCSWRYDSNDDAAGVAAGLMQDCKARSGAYRDCAIVALNTSYFGSRYKRTCSLRNSTIYRDRPAPKAIALPLRESGHDRCHTSNEVPGGGAVAAMRSALRKCRSASHSDFCVLVDVNGEHIDFGRFGMSIYVKPGRYGWATRHVMEHE